MRNIFDKMKNAINHLKYLHEVFSNPANFNTDERLDFEIYSENLKSFSQILDRLKLVDQLYTQKGRQMILADLFEYIFLGRLYYFIKSTEDRENFIKLILRFVNLLMSYETLTVSNGLRKQYLDLLETDIQEIKDEENFQELKAFKGSVGLKSGESDASPVLDKYFDTILPKTAGGLWHELLVYIFILRNNLGYIIPLLLSQRLIGLDDHLVPPDFLLITKDKRIYGIEVGIKKEIQSGSFSLQTAIPTATIDTINSRTSDRCPICKRWIPFCEYIIDNYSKFDIKIDKAELRCLEDCKLFSPDDISEGKCPYTKYSRNEAKTLDYAKHQYATGLHYHYRCVLNKVSKETKQIIIQAKDKIALKTHYPYYLGLEALMK